MYLYRVRLGLDVSLAEVERLSGYSAALISAVESGTRRLTEPVEAALISVYSSLLRERLDACRADCVPLDGEGYCPECRPREEETCAEWQERVGKRRAK